MVKKSPCWDCDYLDEPKSYPRCTTCVDRIAYAKEVHYDPLERAGEEPIVSINRNYTLTKKPRTVRYCDEEGCDEIYYCKGKCKLHYRRKKREELGPNISYKSGKTIILDFRRVDGGLELNDLIRKIAKYEQRSVRTQGMLLVEEGVYQWLKAHEMA